MGVEVCFKHHLLKRLCFLLLNCSGAFVKNELILHVCPFDWKLLHFINLSPYAVTVLFDDCLVGRVEIRSCKFLLFQVYKINRLTKQICEKSYKFRT